MQDVTLGIGEPHDTGTQEEVLLKSWVLTKPGVTALCYNDG